MNYEMPIVNDSGYPAFQQILQAGSGSFHQRLFGGPVAEKGGQGGSVFICQSPFPVFGGFGK